ncbi:MAG: MGMT family protein [Kofleriaceae bacterium]|jgi:methylated-DNA-protein-cysteine methyltransferase-like protein|nr:MGMT family protein [Kofleriaceae bacterium]MBP6836107.1 MGMT family protein [Kofleriaceae bacterium]MBP9203178.1 MGMT family protein [Kofleriaceae bacterium]
MYARILEVVRAVPRGLVVTYGQAAELAGLPGGGRVAAAALKVGGAGVPWQRVLGKASGRWARVAILDPVGAAMQRQRLEREGVVVDERGQVDLDRHGWVSRDGTRRPTRTPRRRSRA